MNSTAIATERAATTSAEQDHWGVVAAAAAVVLAEGYDLLIYSNAIPSLLADAAMGMDKSSAGIVGSMAFIGMLVGGVLAGRVVAAVGLARLVLLGLLGFTLATGAMGLAHNAWQLGALRVVAGLGLGLVLPAAMSLARSRVRQERGAMAISIVMSSVAVGGMLAALMALWIIPAYGWRALFASGAVLGLLLMALVASRVIHAARAVAQASRGSATKDDVPPAPWHSLFTPASRPVLLLGTLATLCDLLAFYGLSTWLTQLMREFDLPLSGALQLMFTLNVGAVVGSLVTAALAIRLGTRAVAVASGLVAAICLIAIASRVLSGWGLFALIGVLGMGAISAQNLVNSLVADAFSPRHRAAALGITLGVGRLGAVIAPTLGGQILAAGHGPSWVLLAFAIFALLGALLLLPLGRERIQGCYLSLP